ncbi:MAG: GNAT family N-acetyltransferase [Saprospiraceae bacterium]|nr:GNAT family N-acetyltransferase [Saprospiraceae bacterium]
MTNNNIKKAKINDVPGLAILFDQYRVFYRKESDVASAVSFLTDRLSRDESVIFLCEREGKLAGFVQLYPLFSSTRMQRLWLLNDLFVAEEFRGQGVSKALIEASRVFGIETGACGLSLETEKTNLIANQLYKATDWELDEEHNYYFLSTK